MIKQALDHNHENTTYQTALCPFNPQDQNAQSPFLSPYISYRSNEKKLLKILDDRILNSHDLSD